MKILIVEDDKNSRILLEKALSTSVYTVESAVNGVIALEKARQSPPDIIISDIRMPEMDGFELCRRIKKDDQLRSIPFIFYTSTHVDSKDRKLGLSLGASRFVVKPMDHKDFYKVISDVLQEHKNNILTVPDQTMADNKELTGMYSEALARKLDKKINDLENQQAALQESEERYRSLIENIDLGIALIDREHRIVMSNMAQGNFFKKHPRDFVGKYCYQEFEKREKVCDHCPGVLAMSTRQKSVIETIGVRDDGSRFPVLIKAIPVFGPDRTVTGFIEVTDDITERNKDAEELSKHREHLEELVKEQTSELIKINKDLEHEITERKMAEAESLRASQLASLGELAAGVAHEINNPINGVINYSQILMNNSTPGTKEHDIAVRIIKESDRIAGIVNKLLSFAHAREEGKKSLNISKILSEALSLTESQLRQDCIIVKVNLPSTLRPISAQPQQLVQVFLNILSNSRYALNRKYEMANKDKLIEVTVAEESIDDCPYIHIIFYDNGTGIPKDQIGKLLDPFFSTKPSGEGTGLGLSISHDIIVEHGGRISFDSVMGKYTKVIIYMPIEQ